MNAVDRFMEKVIPEPMSGCWIWIGACFRLGYGNVRVVGKNRPAHRVAWELFRGPIPDGLDVLHKCDVRPCVNPDHLFLGSHKDNMADKASKGRCNIPYGENNVMAKLTISQVKAIRQRYVRGNGVLLAREFGVSSTVITNITKRKSWRKVA